MIFFFLNRSSEILCGLDRRCLLVDVDRDVKTVFTRARRHCVKAEQHLLKVHFVYLELCLENP